MSVLNDKKVSELEAVYLFSYLSCAMTLDKLLMHQHTYAYTGLHMHYEDFRSHSGAVAHLYFH